MKLLPAGGIKASIAGDKKITGVLNIENITDDSSFISSSASYEFEARCVFSWTIGGSTNRGVTTEATDGDEYLGPLHFTRGLFNKIKQSGAVSAVDSSIFKMVLGGDTTDKGAAYFLELLFKNT